MNTAERQTFIQRIQDGVALWESTCSQLPSEDLEWQASHEIWSIKQITCHVADGFAATIERVQHMLAEESPWILTFDADQWALERGYQQKTWSGALDSLKKNMVSFLDVIAPLDNATLKRDGKQSNIARILGLPSAVVTIADLLRFEAEHVEEHLQEVNKVAALFAEKGR